MNLNLKGMKLTKLGNQRCGEAKEVEFKFIGQEVVPPPGSKYTHFFGVQQRK